MATLVRWEPFREIASLQNDMGRLMSAFLGQSNEAERTSVPAVDVWEADGEIVYAFDLPGIREEDISVELDEGSLTVSGRRERSEKVTKDGFYRFERRFGSFSRTVGVPQGVSEEDVKADYRDGVLTLTIPVAEEAKPRKISVSHRGQPEAVESSAS